MGLDIWYLYSCLVCNVVLKVFRFRVGFVWNGLRGTRDWHLENYVSICFFFGCECTFITHLMKVTDIIFQHDCSTVHSTGWLSWEIEARGCCNVHVCLIVLNTMLLSCFIYIRLIVHIVKLSMVSYFLRYNCKCKVIVVLWLHVFSELRLLRLQAVKSIEIGEFSDIS